MAPPTFLKLYHHNFSPNHYFKNVKMMQSRRSNCWKTTDVRLRVIPKDNNDFEPITDKCWEYIRIRIPNYGNPETSKTTSARIRNWPFLYVVSNGVMKNYLGIHVQHLDIPLNSGTVPANALAHVYFLTEVDEDAKFDRGQLNSKTRHDFFITILFESNSPELLETLKLYRPISSNLETFCGEMVLIHPRIEFTVQQEPYLLTITAPIELKSVLVQQLEQFEHTHFTEKKFDDLTSIENSKIRETFFFCIHSEFGAKFSDIKSGKRKAFCEFSFEMTNDERGLTVKFKKNTPHECCRSEVVKRQRLESYMTSSNHKHYKNGLPILEPMESSLAINYSSDEELPKSNCSTPIQSLDILKKLIENQQPEKKVELVDTEMQTDMQNVVDQFENMRLRNENQSLKEENAKLKAKIETMLQHVNGFVSKMYSENGAI